MKLSEDIEEWKSEAPYYTILSEWVDSARDLENQIENMKNCHNCIYYSGISCEACTRNYTKQLDGKIDKWSIK